MMKPQFYFFMKMDLLLLKNIDFILYKEEDLQ